MLKPIVYEKTEQMWRVRVYCPTKRCTETHGDIKGTRLIEGLHNDGLIIYQNVRCPILSYEKQGELW